MSEPVARTAHLLNGLPSIWIGPVCSMYSRVNGTGVEYMGRPIYSIAHRADGTGSLHLKSK